MAAAMWFGLFNSTSMVVAVYYLSIWLQAIKGATAVRSGIMLLPMILSTTFASHLVGNSRVKTWLLHPILHS